MNTGIVMYLSISKIFCKPSIQFNWGNATHFMHDEDGVEKPLNKEYSMDIHFGWVHFEIQYTDAFGWEGL